MRGTEHALHPGWSSADMIELERLRRVQQAGSRVEGRGQLPQALFEYSWIRINPRMSGWIEVELEINYTSIHVNTRGLR